MGPIPRAFVARFPKQDGLGPGAIVTGLPSKLDLEPFWPTQHQVVVGQLYHDPEVVALVVEVQHDGGAHGGEDLLPAITASQLAQPTSYASQDIDPYRHPGTGFPFLCPL
jgi:hypothetical protein